MGESDEGRQRRRRQVQPELVTGAVGRKAETGALILRAGGLRPRCSGEPRYGNRSLAQDCSVASIAFSGHLIILRSRYLLRVTISSGRCSQDRRLSDQLAQGRSHVVLCGRCTMNLSSSRSGLEMGVGAAIDEVIPTVLG